MLRSIALIGLLALLLGARAPSALAQSPTLPDPLPEPGGGSSLLGPSPGASGTTTRESPGSQEGILSGRPGPSVPRAPTNITRPGDPLPG